MTHIFLPLDGYWSLYAHFDHLSSPNLIFVQRYNSVYACSKLQFLIAPTRAARASRQAPQALLSAVTAHEAAFVRYHMGRLVLDRPIQLYKVTSVHITYWGLFEDTT